MAAASASQIPHIFALFNLLFLTAFVKLDQDCTSSKENQKNKFLS